MTYYTRGKTLHIPDFFKWTNDTDLSTTDKPEWIDTSQLEHFQIELYSNMGEVGQFTLHGNNSAVAGTGASCPLTPASFERWAHHGPVPIYPVGVPFVLPESDASHTLLNYKNLPRWVRPLLNIPATGKTGAFVVNVFGWMT